MPRDRIKTLVTAGSITLVGVLAASVMVRPVRAQQAQALTADRLYQLCHNRASKDWESAGQFICPSYIRGILEGARLQAFHVTGSADTYKSVMQFCEPPGTTGDTAILVVMRFIESQPQSRPLSAAAIVYEAFSIAWPCPK